MNLPELSFNGPFPTELTLKLNALKYRMIEMHNLNVLASEALVDTARHLKLADTVNTCYLVAHAAHEVVVADGEADRAGEIDFVRMLYSIDIIVLSTFFHFLN